MLYQKASKDPSAACYWDYHVILIHTSKIVGKRGKSYREVNVLDIDTCLSYPCSLHEYIDASFGEIQFPNHETKKKLEPMFRVIRADYYLQHFKSDRSHMKRPDGTWMTPPPKYDCIIGDSDDEGGSNLEEYIDMTRKAKGRSSKFFGEVLTIDQLLSKFDPLKR